MRNQWSSQRLTIFLGLVAVSLVLFSFYTSGRIRVTTSILGILLASVPVAVSIAQLYYYLRDRTGKTLHRKVSLNSDLFVNRDTEIQAILQWCLSGQSETAIVTGPKGIGKSQLLRVTTDLINSNAEDVLMEKVEKCLLREVTRKNSALYFDLTDLTGIDDIKNVITSKSLAGFEGSYELFLQRISSTTEKRLVIVLDNLNSIGILKRIESLFYTHWELRPQDRFIVGSIHESHMYSMQACTIRVSPFRQKEILEYMKARRHTVTTEDLRTLLEQSQGLPVFLDLLSQQIGTPLEESTWEQGLRRLLEDRVIPLIPTDLKSVLVLICELSVTSSHVDCQLLRDFGVKNPEEKIANLERFSLVRFDSVFHEKSCKAHDLIRDAVLETLTEPALDWTWRIGVYYEERGLNRESLLHFARSGRFLEKSDLAVQVIEAEIGASNYPFLLSVVEALYEHHTVKTLLHSNREMALCTAKARLVSLLGVGNYLDAERVAQTVVLGLDILPRVDQITSQSEFQLHFMLADIDHLLNRYTVAVDSFFRLKRRAEELEYSDLIPSCLWGAAHCLRHRGKDLESAISTYESCRQSASEVGDCFHYVRAILGKVCISLLQHRLENINPLIFEEAFASASKSNNGTLASLMILKYKAIYLRLLGDYEGSLTCLDRSYKGMRKLAMRQQYNLRFEYGEHYRAIGDYASASENYEEVLAFAERNRDRNLRVNALLGLIATRILTGGIESRDLADEIRLHLGEAAHISQEADVHISYLQALILMRYADPEQYESGLDRSEQDMRRYLLNMGLQREATCFEQVSSAGLQELRLILL